MTLARLEARGFARLRVWALIVSVMLSSVGSAHARSEPHPLHIYLFWSENVSFAVRANDFLKRLAGSDPSVKLDAYEVGANSGNLRLFERVLARIGTDVMRVPFTVIGSEVFVGFESDDVTGADFIAKIEQCRQVGCPDRLYDLLDSESPEVVMGNALVPLATGFIVKSIAASALQRRK